MKSINPSSWTGPVKWLAMWILEQLRELVTREDETEARVSQLEHRVGQLERVTYGPTEADRRREEAEAASLEDARPGSGDDDEGA